MVLNRLRETFPDLVAVPPRCPIPWRPNALAPVFYAYQDVAPESGVFPAYPGR